MRQLQKIEKTAIVYDWLDSWGGVERMLVFLKNHFPEADFYSSVFNPSKITWLNNNFVKTSFIDRLPRFIKNNRMLSFVLYPLAFESFDFSQYDKVISVTSSFAKGIITRPETEHICILLTPTRYLWFMQDIYVENYKFIKFLLNLFLRWDFISAQRPDKIISISETVRRRCEKVYRRKSKVIYPPFDLDYWSKLTTDVRDNIYGDYYLIVSRLEPYKKIDLVIKVFNKIPQKKLIIVGSGSLDKKLQYLACSKNIVFLSQISDVQLASLFFHSIALIMPQEEDFGYVSLEAQACNCPVIAFRRGGATETVLENKTGIFFENQDFLSLEKVISQEGRIRAIKQQMYLYTKKHLQKFSQEQFISSLDKILKASSTF